MSTKAPARPPTITLAASPLAGGTTLEAVYTWHTWRFLLANGTTIDVYAIRDDSELRAAVVAATGQTIAGVTILAQPATDQLALEI